MSDVLKLTRIDPGCPLHGHEDCVLLDLDRAAEGDAEELRKVAE